MLLPLRTKILEGTEEKKEKTVLPKFILDRIQMHEAVSKLKAYNAIHTLKI